MKKISLFLILFSVLAFAQTDKALLDQLKSNPKSDVFMQGFYWNSPPGGIWFDSLSNLAVKLASAGFGGLWIPPACKGGGASSMGYDIYDHYDFGEFNQKGSVETRFGSRNELQNMVSVYSSVGIDLYFDAVLNHVGNGDFESKYLCSSDSGFNVMNPASGRFPKSAINFHPNLVHCDNNAPYHDKMFFEDLCYSSGHTADSMIVWGNYIINTLGFKGFRIDAIKHVEPDFVTRFTKAFPTAYVVGEHWSGSGQIIDYMNEIIGGGGHIAMLDFPLRYTFKDMCNNTSGSFNMNYLDGAGLISAGASGYNVSTFVENHDFDRLGWDGSIDVGHDPILSDKDMAYAYTIFSEGRPVVFFKDYFDYGLGGKIDTLIWIRQNYIYGGTTERGGLNPYYTGGSGSQSDMSNDIYVARRNGGDGHPEVYLVLNDNESQWRGVWVNSTSANKVFRDYTGQAMDKVAAGDGRVELWAPPRGYAVYVADTTKVLNNPPVLQTVPDMLTYTNAPFTYKLKVNDANNDPLTYSIYNNPSWMSMSADGKISGTPLFADTAVSNIVVKVSDTKGATVSDTFKVQVKLNYAPVVQLVGDTVIKATVRYEKQITAFDQDSDSLFFSFKNAPPFLSIGNVTGLISGTPAVTDTGLYTVNVQVTDKKGGFDSTLFKIRVVKNIDSVIATYKKPVMDGSITIGEVDWLNKFLIAADSDTDSKWNPHDTVNNELFGVYATWDADSLYLGVDYIINDAYNTLMVYVDAGIDGGVTNFNSTSGYTGDYPKNYRFRTENAVDLFTASYNQTPPGVYKTEGNTSVNITPKIKSYRGPGGKDSETAIAWDEIYGLGAGKIPNGVKLKFVALVSGGYNWGAGDSAPDNIDVDGNAGPDSLINLAEIQPDKDNNGIPDPTVFLTDVKYDGCIAESSIPEDYKLKQNFPNPFNPSTVISYQLPERGMVELRVYDILGREVATLVEEVKEAGTYFAPFNASSLPSGIYIYRLRTNQFTEVKKMTLIK